MSEDSVIAGLALVAVVPFVAWDAVGSLRAGFDNAFWARPLEGKMERIDRQRPAWHRLGIVWLYINVLLAAGLTAFTFQLAAHGEEVWAALGLGAFLLGAAVFLSGAVLMVTTIGHAAGERDEDGSVPPWAFPVWQSTWWSERFFVIGANLAYVAWGIGIVAGGFPATWAGWVAIASGALIAAWASLREYFFQHMVLVTPLVLGVALILD